VEPVPPHRLAFTEEADPSGSPDDEALPHPPEWRPDIAPPQGKSDLTPLPPASDVPEPTAVKVQRPEFSIFGDRPPAEGRSPLEGRRKVLLVSVVIFAAAVIVLLVLPASAWPFAWSGRGPRGDLSDRVICITFVLAVIVTAIAVEIIRLRTVRDAILGVGQERPKSYQKILGAGVVILTTLIAVFGVLRTVETNAATAASQMRADEEVQLNERYEAAASMLGSDSAAVRAAAMTALAALADDWTLHVTDWPAAEQRRGKVRRDAVISTMTAYLKQSMPTQPDDPETSRESAWFEERAVRVTFYQILRDHLPSVVEVRDRADSAQIAPHTTDDPVCDSAGEWDDVVIDAGDCVVKTRLKPPASGFNWADHNFDFANSELPDLDLSRSAFACWNGDQVGSCGSEVDFSYALIDGETCDLSHTVFANDMSFSGATFTTNGGDVSFTKTQFNTNGGNVSFGGVTFNTRGGYVAFYNTEFNTKGSDVPYAGWYSDRSNVVFNSIKFATRGGYVSFHGAKFTTGGGYVTFGFNAFNTGGGSHYSWSADTPFAEFNTGGGSVSFDRAVFNAEGGGVWFSGSRFTTANPNVMGAYGGVSFDQARFVNSNTYFSFAIDENLNQSRSAYCKDRCPFISGASFDHMPSLSGAIFGVGECGQQTACMTDFSGVTFGNSPTSVDGLLAAATAHSDSYLYSSDYDQTMLAGGRDIIVGWDDQGQICRLVNDSTTDQPVAELPEVCS
jgi:hypothetical protein